MKRAVGCEVLLQTDDGINRAHLRADSFATL